MLETRRDFVLGAAGAYAGLNERYAAHGTKEKDHE
jgi:hypothetical protein